jgi:transposase
VAELVSRIRVLTTQVQELTRQITVRVQRHAPQLLTLAGCGPLCAAKLLVETADVRRFKSDAAFAMHAGVAPIPASSGKLQRHRLNRGGNRQLNAALHRIAVTQLRVNAQAQAFRQRRLTAGSTRAEALRALKRHLARRVYHLLHSAQQAQHHHHQHGRGAA